MVFSLDIAGWDWRGSRSGELCTISVGCRQARSHILPRSKGWPFTTASWCVQHVLEEVIIFSRLTMTKINSSWKGCDERLPQLTSALFFIYPALIPVTFGHQPKCHLYEICPLDVKGLSFLMMGGELGCEAEVLVQLTWPRGESSRSMGVIGTGHSLLARAWGGGGMGRERTWEYSAIWSRSLIQGVLQGLQCQVHMSQWLFCSEHLQVSSSEDFFAGHCQLISGLPRWH